MALLVLGLAVARLRSPAAAPPVATGGDTAASESVTPAVLAETTGDLSHQHKFFILRDGQNAPIGSRDAAPLAAGERRVFWARYPAPDQDDQEVVVHVPHADPMPNVPVGQRMGP